MSGYRPAAQAQHGPGGIEPEAVRIRLLGGFRVSVGSRVVEADRWRLRKAGSLVKLLALARGHRLHHERAMELLWPELEEKPAANNLHLALHFARRALEAGATNATTFRYLHLQGGVLTLCPEGQLWVDAEAFEEAAAAARRGRREPAAYRAAIELYAGDLLPEDPYESWAEHKREGLRRSYLALLLELAALYEEREEYAPAIETLQRVVAEEPSQEEAHTALMRLHALSERHHEAILQYERLHKALREGLDEGPGEASRRLYEQIRAGKFPAASPPSPSSAERPAGEPSDPSPNNLPAPLTSFVGRESAMLEVKRLLAMTRLLTLTGAGGTGKTRLALEVARDLLGAYPDGAWLVELAPLSDPALVPQVVAAALGVREQPGRSLTQALCDYLKPRQTLLVLDNCEHLVDATARLAQALLRACPKLRVLSTSREPLGVPGEAVWTVPPLSLPDAEGASSVEGLMSNEAVRLFLDRARSRLPTFELRRENTGAVFRVCHKLEGIPLAIELATARMGALAVEQVAERLDDSLKLLSGGIRTVDPRHRTMRAALAWSHELLDEPEKGLFARLSAFAGGWTLEAAEDVCSGEDIERDDVLDLLSRLVDKSLVVAGATSGAGGALRYRMLEPVRQYGRERLEESGEAEWVRERHTGYYLRLAERVEPELTGGRPLAWLELLETEYGNLRAALSWALDADEQEPAGRAEMGLRLAAALGRFWDAHAPGEGRRWLEKGLAGGSGAAPASVRAKALNEVGFVAVYEGDPKAVALLEESLALYKRLGDKRGTAYAICNMGHAMVHVGLHERAASLREEAEALMSEPSEKRVRARLLMFLGLVAASELRFDQMESRLKEALALFRELEDVRSISECLLSLGYVAVGQDDPGGAEMFEEALVLQRELKQKTHIFMGVSGMVGMATLRGQPSRSAKLMGASEAMREEIGLTLTSSSKAHFDYEKYLASVREALGEAAFEAAFSEGHAMSPEEAIEYALSKEGEEPPTLVPAPEQRPPADGPTERLTPREREVALLVGRELTNRQIASELSISEHTVANHVAKILKKLGLRSRAQIGARLMMVPSYELYCSGASIFERLAEVF